MAIETVPKSWNKLLRLDLKGGIARNAAGDEITEDDLFITIEAFPPPQIQYLNKFVNGAKTPYKFNNIASSSRGGYRFLYPSTSIQERIQHEYNQDSSTFASAVNNIMDKGASLINAWSQFLKSGTEGAVYDAPILWISSNRREFNLDLNLFAYDDMESDIYGPIRFFRKHSYPKQSGGISAESAGKVKSVADTLTLGLGGELITKAVDDVSKRLGMIEYPSVFKITGGAFDTFNAIESLAFYTLKGVAVDYNDSIKFHKRGFPMGVKLTLTFEECIKLYSNMIDESQVTVSLSSVENGEVVPVARYPKIGVGGPVESLKAKVVDASLKYLAATNLVKLEKNLKERAIAAAITFTLQTIQKSSIYKKLDSVINMDPVHTLEMRQYTKKGFSRSSESIEPAHENEITAILRKQRG